MGYEQSVLRRATARLEAQRKAREEAQERLRSEIYTKLPRVAAIDRELCARQARSQLLDKIYGGATGDLIAAFLKESHITPEERDRLRQLLDDMEV